MQLLHLYISAGHNFRGRHGLPAGGHPVFDVPEIHCVAGRGIREDRYFDHKPDFKGQITFFQDEVYQLLCTQFNVRDKPPSVFRRNIITSGIDLNSLIGREFEVQGVRFFGTETCAPCHWMNQAFCLGAEAAMQSRGGLRARILNDGILRVT
jgi:MOSC domain-containing protein YiiM